MSSSDVSCPSFSAMQFRRSRDESFDLWGSMFPFTEQYPSQNMLLATDPEKGKVQQKIAEAAQRKEELSSIIKFLLEITPKDNIINWQKPVGIQTSQSASVSDDAFSQSFLNGDFSFSDLDTKGFYQSPFRNWPEDFGYIGDTSDDSSSSFEIEYPDRFPPSPNVFLDKNLDSQRLIKTNSQIYEQDRCLPSENKAIDVTVKEDPSSKEGIKKHEKVQHGKGLKNKGKTAKAKKKETKRHMKPREKPNNCIHLHEFLEELLKDNKPGIAWTSIKNREFRLIDSKKIAEYWGERKNKSGMTYDKMARSIRYYYGLGIMNKVPNKRMHFAFGNPKVWKKV